MATKVGVFWNIYFAHPAFTYRGLDYIPADPLPGFQHQFRYGSLPSTLRMRNEDVKHPVPNGEQTIVVSSPGYASVELKLTFPLADTSERTVFLEVNNEVGEVIITSTRTGREIEAEPTRVEAIDEEEVNEKITMRPANVSMVLNESTGIKVPRSRKYLD